MHRPLVVLATGTTALRGAPHLVELAAVRVAGGEVQASFEERVCPAVPIEPEAQERHGLGDGDVRSASTAAEVLQRFSAWVGEEWLAAHDADHDAEVLGFAYARPDLQPPPGPLVPVRALAARHLPEARDLDLAGLCAHLDLAVDDTRGALARAVACWKVLEECLERGGGLDGARDADLLGSHGRLSTIAGARPGPPRLSPRLRPLEAARLEQRVVTILYGEKDGAPAPLPVLPHLLFERRGHGYMEAECQASMLLKTYRLERVRKVLENAR